MKLIFAQGNPGAQYSRTRHNVGFSVLDTLAERVSASWKEHGKWNALVAETNVSGEKVLFVKPLSYYNETGQVARAIVDFYKLDPAQDVLVVHDDLALPLGTVRVREKGSDAGNNGIKSLNTHLGADYRRLRIGIWNERRDQMDDADFVLSAFNQEEADKLEKTIVPHAVDLIDAFVAGRLDSRSDSL